MDEIDFDRSYDYFAHCLDKTLERTPWPDALYKVIPHTPPDDYYFVRNCDSWLELGTLLSHIQTYQQERSLPELTNTTWTKVLSLSDNNGQSIYANRSGHSLYMFKTPILPWTDLSNDVLYLTLLHKFAMDSINSSIEYELNNTKGTSQSQPPILAGILARGSALNLYELINARPDLEGYLPADLKSFVDLARNIHDPNVFEFVMRYHGQDTSRMLKEATENGMFGAFPCVSSYRTIEAYKKAIADRTASMNGFKRKLNKFAIRYHKRVQLPQGDSITSSFKRLRLGFRFNSTQSYESIHKLVLLGLASNFGLYKNRDAWKAQVAKEALSGPLCNIRNHHTSFDVVKPILTLLIDDDYSYTNIVRLHPLLNTLESPMLSAEAITWFRELYTKMPESDKEPFINHLADTSIATLQSDLQKKMSVTGMHLLHSLFNDLDVAKRVDIITRIAEVPRPSGFDLEDIYTNAFDTSELIGDIETESYLDYVYTHMQRWLPEYEDDIHCAMSLGLRLETFLHQLKTPSNENSLVSEDDQAVELPHFEF